MQIGDFRKHAHTMLKKFNSSQSIGFDIKKFPANALTSLVFPVFLLSNEMI